MYNFEQDVDHCEDMPCCTMSEDERCSLHPATRDQSLMIFPGGETRCIFSYSRPYSFQVIKGDADKLLIFLKGGGACWDEEATVGAAGPQCSINVKKFDQNGIYARNDKRSYTKFASYTSIGILYCSGDNHIGNVTRPYKDKAGGSVEQRGLVNLNSVLEWIREQQQTGALAGTFSDLVISGGSAGSVAVQLASKYILTHLQHQHAALIADSGIALFPRTVFGKVFPGYGYCESGILGETVAQKCKNGDIEVTDVVLDLARAFPDVTLAYIFSKQDDTERRGYEEVGVSGNYPDAHLTPEEYYRRANEIFLPYADNLRNFVIYLVDGDQHVFTSLQYLFSANAYGKLEGLSSSRHKRSAQEEQQQQQPAVVVESLLNWVQRLPLRPGEEISSVCVGHVLHAKDIGLRTHTRRSLRGDDNYHNPAVQVSSPSTNNNSSSSSNSRDNQHHGPSNAHQDYLRKVGTNRNTIAGDISSSATALLDSNNHYCLAELLNSRAVMQPSAASLN